MAATTRKPSSLLALEGLETNADYEQGHDEESARRIGVKLEAGQAAAEGGEGEGAAAEAFPEREEGQGVEQRDHDRPLGQAAHVQVPVEAGQERCRGEADPPIEQRGAEEGQRDDRGRAAERAGQPQRDQPRPEQPAQPGDDVHEERLAAGVARKEDRVPVARQDLQAEQAVRGLVEVQAGRIFL
jgi:hypothetical protein